MKKWLFKILGLVTEPPDDDLYLRQRNKWVADKAADPAEVIKRVRDILNNNH